MLSLLKHVPPSLVGVNPSSKMNFSEAPNGIEELPNAKAEIKKP